MIEDDIKAFENVKAYVNKTKPIIVYTTGSMTKNGNPIVVLHKGFQKFALSSFDEYEEITNREIKYELISFHNETILNTIKDIKARKGEYEDMDRILLVMEDSLVNSNYN